MTLRVIHGDCMIEMPKLPAEQFHAVVTDPPYHLASIVKRFGSEGAAPAQFGTDGAYARASRGFMGQTWDGGDIAFQPETWRAVYDLLKPGAHLAAFGGTRTFHRMAVAIEDAGFEIRDTLSWLYGTGFPKSHNLDGERAGWGTALKPGWEPIILARKPLAVDGRDATVAANVCAHGTGAIHIDACRIEGVKGVPASTSTAGGMGWRTGGDMERKSEQNGRWPANVLHDGSDEVMAAFAAFGSDKGQAAALGATGRARPSKNTFGDMAPPVPCSPRDAQGTAARFFKSCEYSDIELLRFHYSAKADKGDRADSRHPTVKPVDLMRWLVTLICPPGGHVLDCFAGSGTTGEACMLEGLDCTLIEREAKHADDIKHRIKRWSGLDAPLFATKP